jgi:hypothetical protein
MVMQIETSMSEAELKPMFGTRVDAPIKAIDQNVLKVAMRGVKKQISKEHDPDNWKRLRKIKKQLKYLIAVM